MAVSKQAAAPPTPLTPIALFVTVLATAAAAWFQYPAAPVALLGVVIAGFLSKPPQLTGPADPVTQIPTVGNPGEAKAAARHRFWARARLEVFKPSLPWPTTFAQVAAAGAALLVLTLPIEGTWFVLDWAGAGSALPFLPYVNAACAYLLIAQLSEVKRSSASDRDPMPATEVRQLLERVGKDQRATAAVAVMIVVAFGTGIIAWWWLVTADFFWIQPAWAAGLGVAVLLAAAIGHGTVRDEVRRAWANTVEARAAWEARFAMLPKLKSKPELVTHQRLGEHGECWIDIFEARADDPAINWRKDTMPPGIEGTLPPNTLTVFTSALDVDAAGQPIPMSRSALRFRVISWQLDHTPDILDPAIDRDLLAAWLQAILTQTAVRVGGIAFDPIPVAPPLALHLEKDAYEDGETAAWAAAYDIPDLGFDFAGSMSDFNMSMQVAFRSFGDDRIEVIPHNGAFYIGAIQADSTELADDSILDQLEADAEQARWEKIWRDLTGPGTQPPTFFPDQSAQFRLATGEVIERRLFGAPAGYTAQTYFSKTAPAGLRSAIPSSKWATLSYYMDVATRKRMPSHFAMLWSDQLISMNPAQIPPAGGRGSDRDAPILAIAGAITNAFLSAKLARPEVLRVTPLTSRSSRAHIWDISLMLYDGVTLDKVKRAQEQIRLGLGNCDWIRVTASVEGCRIIAGANPQARTVEFANDTSELICTSLDWEQAFTDSNFEINGRVPQLLKIESLPKNSLVKMLTFKIPSGLSVEVMKEKRQKLSGSTGNAFLDIRPSSRAGEAIVYAAIETPLPNLAHFDWAEVSESEAVPFATSMLGEPVVFEPRSIAHLLVLGASGTGKSAMLQSVLTPAAIRLWELHLIDTVKFAADFTYLFPYASSVATETVTAAAALKRIYEEIRRRKELNRQHGVSKSAEIPGPDRPRHMIIMIDELVSTVTVDPIPRLTGKETEADLIDIAEKEALNQAKREIGSILGRIAREARSTGVTILAASQSLTKEESEKTPGVFDVKKQAARVLLGKTGWPEKAGAFRNPDLAPDLGESVPLGRGIFESATGAPLIFQSWFDGDPERDGLENFSKVHLRSMSDHIAAVREPEPVTLLDDDLRPAEVALNVFGAVVASSDDEHDDAETEQVEEEVIGFNWADLDLDSAEPENEITPPESDAIDGENDSVLRGDDPLPLTIVDPMGIFVGVGSDSIECEYGEDRFDTNEFARYHAYGELVLFTDDPVLSESLGVERLSPPDPATPEAVLATVAARAIGAAKVAFASAQLHIEDEFGISLADHFRSTMPEVELLHVQEQQAHDAGTPTIQAPPAAPVERFEGPSEPPASTPAVSEAGTELVFDPAPAQADLEASTELTFEPATQHTSSGAELNFDAPAQSTGPGEDLFAKPKTQPVPSDILDLFDL